MSHLDDQTEAGVEPPPVPAYEAPADAGPSGVALGNGHGSSLDSPEPRSAERSPGAAPAIHDVAVEVYAVLGQSAMPVSQLLRMGRGAVVELNSGVGDQVQIMVNHTLIARGEIVVVNDRIAIEITEIVRRERE